MKGIFISDIHIYDYANYNKFPRYRLQQCRLLSEKIINISKDQNIKICFIAGDISEKSSVRSYVSHEIKKFLKSLCDHFDEVYYILGQHDCESKSNKISEEDSFITAIAPPKMKYMDMKQFMIGNTSIAMMSWRPKQDLTWIDGTVDLFVGHFTNTADSRWAQEIDRSKFKLAIVGDIHQYGQVGNACNIGTPLQCKLGDQRNKTCMWFDFDTKEYGWYDLDPNKSDFLLLEYTNEREKEGFQSDSNTFLVYKPLEVEVADRELKTVSTWSNFDDLILKLMIENGLDELHKTLIEKVEYNDAVDFNFLIRRIKIENYRSIGNLELDFSQGDKIAIFGQNGSGKTSFMRALRDVMFDNIGLKHSTKFGENHVLLEIDYEYQGNIYTVIRGSGDWGLKINDGEYEKYNSKRDFQEDIYRRLPFLNYEDIMFYSAHDMPSIGRLSSERRLRIISKLYRLDFIESLNKSALSHSENIKLEIDRIDGVIRDKRSIVNSNIDKLKNYESITGVIEEIDKQIIDNSNLKIQKERYNNYSNKINELIKAIETANNDIQKYQSYLTSINVDELKSEINHLDIELSAYPKLIQSYNEWVVFINDVQSKIKANNDLIDRNNKEIKKIEGEITNLNNQSNNLSANRCYVCDSELEVDKINALKIKNAEEVQIKKVTYDSLHASNNQISDIISELKKSIEGHDINFYSSNVKKLTDNQTKDLSKKQSISSQITHYETTKSMITPLIKSLEDKKTEYQNLLSNPVENVLVDNIDSIILSLTNLKSNLLLKESLVNTINSLNNEILIEEANRIAKYSEYEIYLKYIQLTSSTGAISKEILTRLADNLTTNEFKYSVHEYTYRNNDYLELKMEYFNGKYWVPYEICSDGQKSLCGIQFLSNILKGTGTLILDEHLKHLDEGMLTKAIDLLEKLNVNLLIVSTHSDSYTLYNKRLFMNLNNGTTEYQVL